MSRDLEHRFTVANKTVSDYHSKVALSWAVEKTSASIGSTKHIGGDLLNTHADRTGMPVRPEGNGLKDASQYRQV